MQELLSKNIRLRREHGAEFQQHFGVPLQQFFDNVYGFDVVAFDVWLGVPDGTSTANHITAEYGAEATALCFKLLGTEGGSTC